MKTFSSFRIKNHIPHLIFKSSVQKSYKLQKISEGYGKISEEKRHPTRIKIKQIKGFCLYHSTKGTLSV